MMKFLFYKQYRKTFFYILLLTISPNLLNAQQIDFKASAPQVGLSGEEFQLLYTINAKGVNFEGPSSIRNFEIVSGPSFYESSNIYLQDGDTVKELTQYYGYVIKSDYPSIYTLPSAKIQVDGKIYVSNTVDTKIVLKEEDYTQQDYYDPDLEALDRAVNTAGESFTIYIIITTLFLIVGFGCLIIGFVKNKKSFKISGFIILGMSIMYILYFFILQKLVLFISSLAHSA